MPISVNSNTLICEMYSWETSRTPKKSRRTFQFDHTLTVLGATPSTIDDIYPGFFGLPTGGFEIRQPTERLARTAFSYLRNVATLPISEEDEKIVGNLIARQVSQETKRPLLKKNH